MESDALWPNANYIILSRDTLYVLSIYSRR